MHLPGCRLDIKQCKNVPERVHWNGHQATVANGGINRALPRAGNLLAVPLLECEQCMPGGVGDPHS